MPGYRKRRRRKNRKKTDESTLRVLIAAAIALALLAAVGLLLWFVVISPRIEDNRPIATTPEVITTEEGQSIEISTEPEDALPEALKKLLADAERTAAMYDYDKAMEMVVSGAPDYKDHPELVDFLSECEAKKSQLIKWGDNSKITHIFFHSLIVDNKKAFASEESAQYNEVMTTIPEFNEIMQQMYDRGFVLVTLYDMAKIVDKGDGVMGMTYQPIYLPAGKTPFVLSVDDVSYYEYMNGDGFANRLVVEEDGRVVCEMDMPDGTKVRGNYDVMPLLDAFIEEHPDFSYHGAKGMIALTGYNGILGYRTSEIAYGAGDPNWPSAYVRQNPDIEEDRKKAMEVAEALKKNGWIFASHTWGHMDMGKERDGDGNPTPRFFRDTDWWETEVEPLLGPVDIIIFAYGADIGSWRGYTDDNQMYTYLKEKGFDYYCNVDTSTHAWVQLSATAGGDGYLRQGRRNLDGMLLFRQAIDPNTDIFFDLIDVETVFDPDRPVPVNGVKLPEDFDAATWNIHDWIRTHKTENAE